MRRKTNHHSLQKPTAKKITLPPHFDSRNHTPSLPLPKYFLPLKSVLVPPSSLPPLPLSAIYSELLPFPFVHPDSKPASWFPLRGGKNEKKKNLFWENKYHFKESDSRMSAFMSENWALKWYFLPVLAWDWPQIRRNGGHARKKIIKFFNSRVWRAWGCRIFQSSMASYASDQPLTPLPFKKTSTRIHPS